MKSASRPVISFPRLILAIVYVRRPPLEPEQEQIQYAVDARRYLMKS
jgi:hypothetical protein